MPQLATNDTARRLVVEDVTMVFSGLCALDSVSLHLDQGEILGLIGPNGSGKTTLINIITGFLKPTSGQVRVGDTAVEGWPPYRISPLGLARTFQTIRLFPLLTVLENVEVAAVSHGRSRAAAKERAFDLLRRLGVEHQADIAAGGLPYGQERRVEIARALATDPTFLLLDEPAAGLNEGESEELLAILSSIPADFDCGMLIVDHDMRLILRLCDRLHALNYGQTIAEGTPAELRQDPEVIRAYLGTAGEEKKHARGQ